MSRCMTRQAIARLKRALKRAPRMTKRQRGEYLRTLLPICCKGTPSGLIVRNHNLWTRG